MEEPLQKDAERIAKVLKGTRETLETVLKEYNRGLITEKERYDAVFGLLYEVLYGDA